MGGMPMGGAGGGSHAAMGHAAAAPGLDLLPEWLGIAGAMMFLLIVGAHLGHLAMTSGERRPWHVLHVLMAIGMAFMYAPATVNPFAVQAEVWQLLFACAAAAAGLRWLAGATGLRAANPLWLLTAIDLGAMVYMWSPGSFVPALTWVLAAYLVVEGGLWVANAYRVLDVGTPLIGWGSLASATGGPGAIVVAGTRTDSLIGGLDISASMTAMAVGMAYMLVAMQLMS